MTSPILERLLDLPKTIDKSQFVVQLADGVAHPEHVLARYAVTPELQTAYKSALSYVESALASGNSNATYIDGTFGSGKSQFMAILSLMLGGREEPWGHAKLHPVLQQHPWVRTKKLLRLHYHFVGVGSVEERLFRGYIEAIEQLHPTAPLPPLFKTDAIFDNASGLLAVMGEASFFQALNSETAAADDPDLAGWGDAATEAAWTPARFDRARAGHDEALRKALFSTLSKTLLPAVKQTSSDFVDIDEGLSCIADHASGLGYEGVVLFLDELILWMASRATNQDWLRSEAQKVAKLVESQRVDRKVPIISFVARQRSIDQMVAGVLEGSGFQHLRDALQYWEGRFSKVVLPGKNLPAIVAVRVVCPKDDATKQELAQAFNRAAAGAGNSWGTLLGQEWQRPDFERVFPFTPALVQVLVELSNYLQRERTGIRVLMEMLKSYLDDYELGKIVPLGDLFDVLAAGEDPLDGQVKARFDLAKRLYRDELLRLIRVQNGTESRDLCQRLREDHSAALGCAGCAMKECRTDNQLIKTLLIAELVPNITLLKDMTASRLVALNHGSITSFIDGEETTMAVQRLRTYAGDLGQLRIGDQADPAVRIALDDLDIRPILAKARDVDSAAQQRLRLRQLLFDVMKLGSRDAQQQLSVIFHETKRTGTLIYGNVRKLDDSTLRAKDDEDFRVVIDYPFDEDNASPQQDEDRLQRYRVSATPTHTLVWLPSFFGAKVRRDLSDLVLVEAVLSQPHHYLVDFRPEDHERARSQLTNLQNQKKMSVQRALQAAYGVSMQAERELDAAKRVVKHVHVLDASLKVGQSGQPQLKDALHDMIAQLLQARFPKHPVFTKKVTSGRLEDELQVLESLAERPDMRLPLAGNELAQVSHAVALGLLEEGRDTVTWNGQTMQRIRQRFAADQVVKPNRQQLLHAFDPGAKAGLTAMVQDFVVRAWAIHERAELHHDGKPLTAVKCGKLPFDAEIVTPERPTDAEWERAIRQAGGLFGLTMRAGVATPRHVRQFGAQLAQKRDAAKADRADELLAALAQWSDFADGSTLSSRQQTAQDVMDLLAGLSADSDTKMIRFLADFEPKRSAQATAAHLTSAAAVIAELQDERNRNSLVRVREMPGAEAARVVDEVRQVLAADEFQSPLASRLRQLCARATLLISPMPPPQRAESHASWRADHAAHLTGQPHAASHTSPSTVASGYVGPPGATASSPATHAAVSGQLRGSAAAEIATDAMREALASAGDGHTLVIDWHLEAEAAQ